MRYARSAANALWQNANKTISKQQQAHPVELQTTWGQIFTTSSFRASTSVKRGNVWKDVEMKGRSWPCREGRAEARARQAAAGGGVCNCPYEMCSAVTGCCYCASVYWGLPVFLNENPHGTAALGNPGARHSAGPQMALSADLGRMLMSTPCKQVNRQIAERLQFLALLLITWASYTGQIDDEALTSSHITH